MFGVVNIKLLKYISKYLAPNIEVQKNGKCKIITGFIDGEY